MKFVLAALAFIGTTVAYAYPEVGEQISYHEFCQQGDQKAEGTEVWTINSYVQAQDMYTLSIDYGNQKTDSVTMTSSQMGTMAAFQELVTNCAANGGTAETLTVDAGTFDTCKLMDGEKSLWFGAVALGVVKFDDGNGCHTDLSKQ